jgi:hypothetical protein
MLQAEAQQLGMELRPVSGGDVQRLIAQILASPDDLAVKARAALQPH